MFEQSGMPPEAFIKEVLERYHIEKRSVEFLAEFYDIPKVTILRIIELYEFNGVDRSIIKKASKELQDKARSGSEKITEEDFKDLDLDLKLFERGNTGQQEEGDR